MRSARRKTSAGSYLALLLAALALLYFGYYALYGERGLLAQRKLEQEMEKTEARLQQLSLEREVLEKRTKGLRPESLDADLIDQQAREQLGLTREGEHVVLTPTETAPTKNNVYKE